MKSMKYVKSLICVMAVGITMICTSGCSNKDEDVIVLRVNNWEEYIDEGEWDEEIELEDGTVITSTQSIVDDFEDWFYKEYGKKVVVEYSTFGTNEDMYNQITLGDQFDLVCPSEYMIMKMMTEDMLEPYSEEFFDPSIENNYYIRNVSPYIENRLENLVIDNKPISEYGAGFMWGTLGFVYNPEYVTREEASHWNILTNPKYYKRITIKDSVRDAYFAGTAINYYDEIMAPEFINDPDYAANLEMLINSTDKQTVDNVEQILSAAQQNVYSFETDAGKADMVTGKVVANQQWSGDGVYTLDQAEEDGLILYYVNPEEATNLWFDGWVMLKDGIDGDPDKKMAAEAFVNYMSQSESAIRNMYYIGYTSVISGGEDDTVMEYVKWCYESEEEDEELIDYDISYFFGRDVYISTTLEDTYRQLGAQYPEKEVLDRAVIMRYFDKSCNERINRMWTNVRCFDLDAWFG